MARLFGGRWSSKGVRVVYAAESVALAVLKVLVHLDSGDVLTAYSLCSAEFDDSLVERLDRPALPANWRDYPAPARLQRVGDKWVASGSSAVLEVPSVIVETESNYLLNPAHPDFESPFHTDGDVGAFHLSEIRLSSLSYVELTLKRC